MALTVEDGTGKADAESYIGVADADTYITDYLGGDATWTAATTTAKEVALRKAAQYLDNNYHGQWRGERATDVYFPGTGTSVRQSLAWPRRLYDEDGPWWDSDEIPTQLKQAQVELAIRAVAGTDLTPDVAAPSVEPGLKRKKTQAGPITTEKEYTDNPVPAGVQAQASEPVFRKVDMLLAGLLSAGLRAHRV
jgi:hypothetical protein